MISSTFRRGTEQEFSNFCFKLRQEGVKARIAGRTPYLCSTRGEEIQQWLNSTPRVTDFVILDDNDTMGELGDRLIQCSMQVGLSKQDADLAIQLLGGHP